MARAHQKAGQKESSFRTLPSVDRLLADERLVARLAQYGREAVVGAAREVLQGARSGIAEGSAATDLESIVAGVQSRLAGSLEPTLRPVINATGVILHTNLGRAPLSREAAEAARQAALGYDNLELTLETGERGSRHSHLEALIARLTGAEAGIAVNNNAAAVTLGLTALAQGREVIISRGEAVEIGGGFRIPEILKASGAILVEVGTTNRTYLADFENATTENTAAYLRVHPSNFRVNGFTAMPTLQELAAFAKRRKVLCLHDLGSGALLDTAQFGLAHEPTAQESLAAGADLVFFSGDKLLGGPQAGIIAGKAKLVEQIKKHPLTRALRIDKMHTAALQATLLHYAKGEALTKLPVWQMLGAQPKELERRARRWAKVVGEPAQVVDAESTVGGGSLPGEILPSRVLAVPGTGEALARMAEALRRAPTPVLARIDQGQLLLDPRTVIPGEDEALLTALQAALKAAFA